MFFFFFYAFTQRKTKYSTAYRAGGLSANLAAALQLDIGISAFFSLVLFPLSNASTK